MEDFKRPVIDSTKWTYLMGGKIGRPTGSLIEGDQSAAVFQGPALRLLESASLDLRSAEGVQFILQFLAATRSEEGALFNRSLYQSVVYLQCSVDSGSYSARYATLVHPGG